MSDPLSTSSLLAKMSGSSEGSKVAPGKSRTLVPNGTTAPTPVPTAENLGQMARQFLDHNVRQYIEQNQIGRGVTTSTLFPNPALLPSNQQSSDVNDELNRELARLRHHLTVLTARGPSSCSNASATPTRTEALQPPGIEAPSVSSTPQLR